MTTPAIQPVLGPLADMIGKTRLMTVCLGVLVINGFVGAAAPNFQVLLASRIATGIAAGGIFPTGLALAGDLVPIHRRQVAISRLLAAGMLGNLLGTPMAGILGDLVGWRFVLAVIGVLCLATFITAAIGFRGVAARAGAGLDLAAVVTGYRTIFRNPQAKYCFGAVMLEGIFMMGIFPYVALLLRAGGEPRARRQGGRGGRAGVGAGARDHRLVHGAGIQTLHFYGSFWPHYSGFNKLNVEANIPDAVYNDLQARGHDVARIRAFGMNGCATAVLIDPATGNRIAGAERRRDCYAIAY